MPKSTKLPEVNSGSIKATLLSVQCSKIISILLSINDAKIGLVLPLVISTSQSYPFSRIYEAIAECMLALSQSNDPILTEQALAEKDCKLYKNDTDKTRNNFLINFIISHLIIENLYLSFKIFKDFFKIVSDSK